MSRNIIRAGRLDRSISIGSKQTDAIDDFGAPTEVYMMQGPYRAELVRDSAGDSATSQIVKEGGAVDSVETLLTFRTRWISGLTVADRLIYENRTFDIIGLVEIGRRRGWQIVCRRRGL
ncbi:phage head completion protein [Methylocystis sp. S23]